MDDIGFDTFSPPASTLKPIFVILLLKCSLGCGGWFLNLELDIKAFAMTPMPSFQETNTKQVTKIYYYEYRVTFLCPNFEVENKKYQLATFNTKNFKVDQAVEAGQPSKQNNVV